MDDFASAAMMRLVHAGLARQGIALSGPAPAGAHVPRTDKRAVLEDVLARHGPAALLRVSEAIPAMPREPIVIALLKASDADDLLQRWARLERFSHARHRIETARVGPHRVRLRHRAKAAGAGPTEAETFLVLGVVAKLVEAVTGRAVVLGPRSAPWRRDGAWTDAPRLPEDRAVEMVHDARSLDPESTGAPDATPVETLRTRIADDPVRRWTVAGAARTLGLSPRSLQRHLAAHGASFSRTVQDARLQVASDLLLQDDGPGLAETGFLSGYSDQAHFTRSFTRNVGTGPGAFRAAFG